MKTLDSLFKGRRKDGGGGATTTVLELNLISAQELQPLRKSNKMNTYVVAYIDPADKHSSRTAVDGGKNPSWNDKLIFQLNVDEVRRRPDLCIVVEIYRARRNCISRFLGRKDERIGYAHIRLHDMIQESSGMVSSRAFFLRRSSGEPVGVLNLGLVGLDAAYHHLNATTGTGFVFRRR